VQKQQNINIRTANIRDIVLTTENRIWFSAYSLKVDFSVNK